MKTQGGKRSGAGRKPVADKKIPFVIYIRESKKTKAIRLQKKLIALIEQ